MHMNTTLPAGHLADYSSVAIAMQYINIISILKISICRCNAVYNICQYMKER